MTPEASAQWTRAEIDALRRALIDQALEQAAGRRGTQAARAASRAWIASRDLHPFSFEVCCRLCGLDPRALRDGLAEHLGAAPSAERAARPAAAARP
jgi:hypothetical protein